jgi:hypothetical protein
MVATTQAVAVSINQAHNLMVVGFADTSVPNLFKHGNFNL